VLCSLVPALAPNLASTNPVTRQLSNTALDLLVSVVSGSSSSGGSGSGSGSGGGVAPSLSPGEFSRESQTGLVSAFAQVALFENVKVRPLAIEKLTHVLSLCGEATGVATGARSSPAHSSLLLPVLKAAVPVAYALTEEARLEVRAPLLRCAQTLHALLGSALWEEKVCMQFHLSSQQVAKLKLTLGVSA